MSSTTEWRKLCEGSNSFGSDALRAACDAIDELEKGKADRLRELGYTAENWNRLSKRAETAEARVRELEDRPHTHQYLEDALRAMQERSEKAEARVTDLEAARIPIASHHCLTTHSACACVLGRMRELEQKLNHESYVSDKRAQERDKAEARLKVAVGALEHYDQWLSDVAEGDPARAALAKLKGEP